MNLLLVRHGETVSNLEKIYAGRSSEWLTERGIIQAKEVSEKLKHFDVQALYSSPIQRAIQTAEIIGKTLGLNVIIEDAFQEMAMGAWEGLHEEKVALLYPEEWQLWHSRPAELELQGRETLDGLLKRVLKGIYKIQEVHGLQNVVIVTHVAIIRVLLLWHSKKSLNLYKTIHVPNAEVFEINLVQGQLQEMIT